MTAHLLIREATVVDAAAIARVHAESWRNTYAGIVPDSYLDSINIDEWTRKRQAALSARDSDTFDYVAELDGSIVGWAVGGPEGGGDPHYQGELYIIYLLASVQRQGIGARLTSEVAKRLVEAGTPSMLVWVLAANTSARRFYEYLGGEYLREKDIDIGGATLREVAYGWKDVRPLAEMRGHRRGEGETKAASRLQ